jgi:hypothetical protein
MKKKLTKGKIVPSDPETSTTGKSWTMGTGYGTYMQKVPRRIYEVPRKVTMVKTTDLGGGLFNLHEQDDGFIRAELGRKTYFLSVQIAASMNSAEIRMMIMFMRLKYMLEKEAVPIPTPIMNEAFEIPRKFWATDKPPSIPLLDQTNIYEIRQAALKNYTLALEYRSMLTAISDAVGSEVNVLNSLEQTATAAEKLKAWKKLNQTLRRVLEVFSPVKTLTSHAGIAYVRYGEKDGPAQEVLLEWLILQLAPRLVETKRALPSKKELRDYVTFRCPDAESLSNAKWSNAFKAAGLSSLPRSESW